jgi:hypothetical protein
MLKKPRILILAVACIAISVSSLVFAKEQINYTWTPATVTESVPPGTATVLCITCDKVTFPGVTTTISAQNLISSMSLDAIDLLAPATDVTAHYDGIYPRVTTGVNEEIITTVQLNDDLIGSTLLTTLEPGFGSSIIPPI